MLTLGLQLGLGLGLGLQLDGGRTRLLYAACVLSIVLSSECTDGDFIERSKKFQSGFLASAKTL